MSFIFDYYNEHGEMPGPAYFLVLLAIMVILLVGITIYNHRQDKK